MSGTEDLLVAGGGPAALTAALYAGRAGRPPLVLEGTAPGGRLGELGRVENYPGFPDGVDGAELALAMRAQAERFGARFRPGEELASFEPLPDGGFLVRTDGGEELRVRALVVATGTRPRRLGVPGEREFAGRGVSWCATCDGPLFKGRDVAVAGGGAPAMAAALFLSRLCRHVTVLFPEADPPAPAASVARVAAAGNVSLLPGARVVAVEGAGRAVDTLRWAAADDPAGSPLRSLPAAGLFVALGDAPALDWDGSGLLAREPDGRLRVGPGGETSVPGVFAAGDVSERLRQVVTAAASGAAAALAALRFLSSSPTPSS